jgi:hypothetical protein
MRTVGALFALAMITLPANADILFNNFGPGDAYLPNVVYSIGRFPGDTITYVQGDAFIVTGGNFTLDSLTLALNWGGSGPNAVDVQLRADAGGKPGAVLESFHLENLGILGLPNPPVIATSALHPLLLAGQQYWVTASASDVTDIGWNFNSNQRYRPPRDFAKRWPVHGQDRRSRRLARRC